MISFALFCIQRASGSTDAKATYTTFDPPGATKTFPASINSNGTIAGYYGDVSGVDHGFARAADGTVTTFDPIGSAGTEATSVNDDGVIVGYYSDGSRFHGFVRAADGTISTFDPAGSVATFATSVNGDGAIAGNYNDDTGAHGYVRAVDGTITTFDPAGSTTTFATSINAGGTITGEYWDGSTYHGFMRASDGTITTFDVGTESVDVTSINKKDATTGYFQHVNGRKTRTYGFVRRGNGAVKEFKVPEAYASYPESINAERWVAGYYRDRAGVYHGFLQTP